MPELTKAPLVPRSSFLDSAAISQVSSDDFAKTLTSDESEKLASKGGSEAQVPANNATAGLKLPPKSHDPKSPPPAKGGSGLDEETARVSEERQRASPNLSEHTKTAKPMPPSASGGVTLDGTAPATTGQGESIEQHPTGSTRSNTTRRTSATQSDSVDERTRHASHYP